MTIRFRWLEAVPDDFGDRYADPPPWPQALLQQHRGRMLRPTEALRGESGETIEATAYRADTLLIPDSLLSDPTLLTAVGQLIGCTFIEPPSLITVVNGNDNQMLRLRELPRPVGVVPNSGSAVPFDPWTAVRQIRAAADELGKDAEQRAALKKVSLDHLLIGTSFGGVPTYDPQDPRVQNYPGGYAPEGRHPVSALVLKPERTSSCSDRRPVVAVLDTGLRQHPWFDELDVIAAGQSAGFLQIDIPTQAALAKHQPVVDGLARTNVLFDFVDDPVYADQLAERVNPATGHGTFITGLIHQHAPNANVQSVRVLRPDNVGYESDLLLAIWLLADRVGEVQAGRTTAAHMVDIVSISLGYYHETWLSAKATRLGEALDQLTEKGVVVVASAGNDSTARAFLPAAIASMPRTADAEPAEGEDPLPPRPPVIGVGALNPNATTSWYSNGGESASCEAPGTCLISTFPQDVVGSISALNTAPRYDRESVDQDDYRGAFAMWSGTSFATPLVAAAVANRLIHLGPNEVDVVTTRKRALAALRDLAVTTSTAARAELSARKGAAVKLYDERAQVLRDQVKLEKEAMAGRE